MRYSSTVEASSSGIGTGSPSVPLGSKVRAVVQAGRRRRSVRARRRSAAESLIQRSEKRLHRGQHRRSRRARGFEHVDVHDPGELELLRPVHTRAVFTSTPMTPETTRLRPRAAMPTASADESPGVSMKFSLCSCHSHAQSDADSEHPGASARPRPSPRRSSLVHRAKPASLACLEEQSLDERGLARSAVSGTTATLRIFPASIGIGVLLGA